MKIFTPWLVALLLPLASGAAERTLKIDPTRSFIDIDVKATAGSFTGHLDHYDAKIKLEANGKIKGAIFSFNFTDLKTGKIDRDTAMLKWLGGSLLEGRFEMGNLALMPDGQGQVSGRLTLHGVTERVEFSVNLTKLDDTYTLTGETVIDHRSWNLKIIRLAYVAKVDPEVKVRFKLTGQVSVVSDK